MAAEAWGWGDGAVLEIDGSFEQKKTPIVTGGQTVCTAKPCSRDAEMPTSMPAVRRPGYQRCTTHWAKDALADGCADADP